MYVLFQTIQQFLDEIETSVHSIHGAAVRVTGFAAYRQDLPTMVRVTVVATARIDDVIVRLDRFCGDYLRGDAERESRVKELEDGAHAAITAKCKSLGLAVRAGLWSDAPGVGGTA
jgi:hypothetical protein